MAEILGCSAGTTATSALHRVLESFFETKTAGDVEGTMAYFAPDMVCYMDATLGWAGISTAMPR